MHGHQFAIESHDQDFLNFQHRASCEAMCFLLALRIHAGTADLSVDHSGKVLTKKS